MEESERMVEEAVLGGMLLHEGHWPSEVLDLEPEYFQDRKNADIFSAVQDLIANHKFVDEVSVTSHLVMLEMEGHASYLCRLAADAPTAVNLPHWSNLLVEAGRKREANRALREAVARVGANGTADEISASVQDAMRDIKPRGEGGLQHVKIGIKATLAELKQEYESPDQIRIAMTGLRDLDEMAELRASQLTCIAGRPGMGKSALAGNIAAHCAQDITRGAVAVFSLEMDTASLVRRMMADVSGYPTRSLPAHANAGDLVETCAKIHNLNLYIDDRPNLGVQQVRQALTKLGDVRLVIFDYLQLAHMDTSTENYSIKVGKITKGLRGIAKELECHVIGLSQLNRAVENRKPPIPQLSDLKESGAIEEDSDNVWFLYRPDYYGNDDEPRGVAQIKIAKQRHGETGTVRAAWLPHIQSFRDLQPGTRA